MEPLQAPVSSVLEGGSPGALPVAVVQPSSIIPAPSPESGMFLTPHPLAPLTLLGYQGFSPVSYTHLTLPTICSV
eukprot:122906-Prorocentrum_lima.AAC.1